jgi:uncharacterized membrane protein
MLIAGALGLQRPEMAHGGLIAISFGLIVAVPTALTGLIDWLAMERGTPARLTATYHLLLMVSATVVFAVAWLIQRPGYVHGHIKPGGWIAALAGELLLAAGGYIGGTIVFHYGHRVLNERDTPTGDALRPVPRRRPLDAGPGGEALRSALNPTDRG